MDIRMFVPQLKTVAMATARPFMPTGKISVKTNHDTEQEKKDKSYRR